MLGIGLMLFCLRGLSRTAYWDEKLLSKSFWALNIGLALMVSKVTRGQRMLRTLMAYLRGEPRVVRIVRVPSAEQEDARRASRERDRLVKEQTGHTNRIKALLRLWGLAVGNPRRRNWLSWLATQRDWQGQAVPSAMARLGDMSGCGARQVLWANVLHLIGERPWTGWGWGELKWAHYMASYPGTRFCDILGNAHNLPLQLAFSFGVPVAALLCATALALLLRARPWRLVQDSDSLAWGALAALGLHSLLEYPLWYGPFQLALLSALALLWPRWPALHARWRPALQTVAASALCVLALIAWDYQRVRQVYLPPEQRSVAYREQPWEVARQTWFFTGALQFAEVGTTTPTPDNAQALLAASLSALHYSPEPRVIDRVIESARLSGQPALADWHAAQKQVVYGRQRP